MAHARAGTQLSTKGLVVRRIEQLALGSTYALAIWLRRVVWGLRRPRLIGVRALIVWDGAVLLVRHRSGRTPWSIPGGSVERYERLTEAARREAHEETGVTVRVERLLGVYDSFRDGISNYIAVFVCTPLGDPCPPRSLEIAEARYFPLAAPPDGLDQGSRRRIAEYRAGEQGVAKLW
jgi:ADP-ribose pyrophosphatase YjhB (NUDIX family)